MPFALIGLALAAWLGSAETPSRVVAALLPAVTFNPQQRQVSNWRIEATVHLDAPVGIAAAMLLGREPRQATRCVRLNNYWCIKRAGWAGEIAADAEGHVAFASAAEGADVAALLLRRYYIDYGRHSARAIVSRWAPASCGVRVVAGAGGGRSPADHLTTRGLGRTLRAGFLARHGRRVVGGRARGRVSAVPDRLIGLHGATPSIAIGAGGSSVGLPAQSDALLPSLEALGAPARAAPTLPACGGDEARIAAYAAKAAAGVAAGPDADLKLFDAAGLPTGNLERLMRNMSAVEIGPLGAGEALVAAAMDRVRQVAARRPSP